MAVCCQNLTLGGLVAAARPLCWLARYLKISGFFLTRLVVRTFDHSRVASLGAPHGRECIEGYNTLKVSSSWVGIEI